jgi:P-type Mg2+ transporter
MAFALLYKVLHTPAEVFQTAWFVESMATQVLVIFVIRTARPCWRDRPSRWLALASVACVGAAFALPFVSWGSVLGFVPLPPDVLGLVVALTLGYLAVAEAVKHLFYRLISVKPLRGIVGIVPA